MRIGMILDKEFPPDTRVENEAAALVKDGHEVFLLCLTYDPDDTMIQTYKGITLCKIFRSKKSNNRARGLINTVLDYNTAYWAGRIKEFAAQQDIDVLHIHDLYLFGAAIRANKKLKLLMVGDTHENYVSGLMQYRFSTTFPGNILISTKKWRRKERKWIAAMDYVITVIQEMKNRVSEYIDPSRIVVYPNVPDHKQFLDYPIDAAIAEHYKNKYTLLYVGGIDYHRGVDTVIKALPLIAEKIPQVHFLVVGGGTIIDGLLKLAADLGVSDRITFTGKVAGDRIPSYCAAADIGMIPHLRSEQTDNSCPNKIFQYMAMELPVLSSDCVSLQRLLDESNAGITYLSGNPEDLALKVEKLYKEEEECAKMGQRGKKAVLNTHNYSVQVQELLRFYQNISLK